MEPLKNPLPKEHLFSVCKPGQGAECCRYLLAGAGGIECGKYSQFKSLLDERVSKGTMVAQGDNCEGVKDYGK